MLVSLLNVALFGVLSSALVTITLGLTNSWQFVTNNYVYCGVYPFSYCVVVSIVGCRLWKFAWLVMLALCFRYCAPGAEQVNHLEFRQKCECLVVQRMNLTSFLLKYRGYSIASEYL